MVDAQRSFTSPQYGQTIKPTQFTVDSGEDSIAQSALSAAEKSWRDQQQIPKEQIYHMIQEENRKLHSFETLWGYETFIRRILFLLAIVIFMRWFFLVFVKPHFNEVKKKTK